VSEPRTQYAALPYRRGARVDILLVTSLETRRWIIPKGWPIEGLAPHECAAAEAFEEAGVEGEVGCESVGAFLYDKRRKSGVVPCRVEVFPLEVTRERENWPEGDRRQRRWFSPEEAAAAASDPSLGDIILALARRLGAQSAAQA
jgi:8-oxo-dGTP pyrophosphatase MutT (NUDIX family)